MSLGMKSRRKFLQQVAFATTATCLPSRLHAMFDRAKSPAWTPLGRTAQSKNLLFGFALNYHILPANAAYGSLVAREATIVVPENAMKWEALHPAPDRYAFEQADAIVAFAEQNSIKLRGHNFCWHRALPPWVPRDVTKDNAEAVLLKHIATVAGRYKGKIHSWDVVNEAIQWKDNQPDGWRNSFWYQMLGPAYMDIAFAAAKEADRAAVLTYNDYGLEYENGNDSQKRRTMLSMLSGLKKRGVPVEALGLQSHLRAGTNEKFSYDLPRFISQVRDLGLRVYITEMDVDDSHLTVEGSARDEAVADVYKRYLDLILGTGEVDLVITWGVWDLPRQVGAEATTGPSPERPLLFAPDGSPKLDAAWVSKVFQHAPVQQ